MGIGELRSIRGDPEMLERLRIWAEPIFGGPMRVEGRGGLRALQEIIEAAADATGAVPQYRKHDA